MSQKSKINRARREAEQKKSAERVILGIFAVLIILGLLFAVFVALNN